MNDEPVTVVLRLGSRARFARFLGDRLLRSRLLCCRLFDGRLRDGAAEVAHLRIVERLLAYDFRGDVFGFFQLVAVDRT